ncbi:hypothetical protein X797_007661 [Metarhizium robertsii]|uniref:Uncharacterized protein n=2 Tax=Metarhizium robertsii TaxID=568076 RepID=A0A0B2XHZ3_METRA|nr:uncharacterized protein MAA_11022 [Metarhizium robertsii ARSEF 23]EXU99233.1 hypothetical protein X797_007661 [Metarhizium robertsii]KHO11506.1 hypothetical protein MAA_11022 [Metarhizium robertsii ARSEF 23]
MKYITIIAALSSLVSAGRMEARVPQDPAEASAVPAAPTPEVNQATMREIMNINKEFALRMCFQLVQIINNTAFRYPEDYTSANAMSDYCREKSNMIYWQLKDEQKARNGDVY